MRKYQIGALIWSLAFGVAHAQSAAQGHVLSGNMTPVTGEIIRNIVTLTTLSLAPSVLIMATSFTRFVIAFSMLRSGLGLPGTPANLVLIMLSLFMTLFVMSPMIDRSWRDGVEPLLSDQAAIEDAYPRAIQPFKEFMLAQVRAKDLALFEAFSAGVRSSANEAEVSIKNLVPAFMISELRRGFEIGFLIMLPFLVIDLIVATLTMSMGVMMLPPSVLALPIKVLFFVLIDGWNLVVGELLKSMN